MTQNLHEDKTFMILYIQMNNILRQMNLFRNLSTTLMYQEAKKELADLLAAMADRAEELEDYHKVQNFRDLEYFWRTH